MARLKNSKRWILLFIAILAVSLIAFGGVYAWQKKKIASGPTAQTVMGLPTASQTTVLIYESYDCDKLREKSVEVHEGETPISTALKYLPSPGSISTVAKYAKSFKIEGSIAYIDWPAEMTSLSNIDTSCAIQAFLLPIDKTLTQIDPIKTVIHSMGGSVNAFYLRMGLSCPKESTDCNYDAVSIPVDKNFRITNIGDSAKLGNSVTTIFPIFAYQCDIYEVKDDVPLRYSKIDFFISKDEKNATAIFLGTTPGGSAGSGECDLLQNESGLNSELVSGKYRVWAVRYIDGKPDKRTADVLITIKSNLALYRGTWFDIEYPKGFIPTPIAPTVVNKGTTSVQTDEAFFKSPGGSVEFFVFSPLWAGDPTDYLTIGASEEVVSDKSDESGSGLDKKIIRWVTVKAKDGSYYRSFESTKSQVGTGSDLHHVFGIKYQNNEAYQQYRDAYVAFKKSLRQYAD